MTSFHVVSCEPELLSEGVASHPEDGNFYKIWTASSAKQVKALSLNLPGVVFIDYDAKLGLSSAPVQPAPSDATTSGFDATQPEEAQGRVVAEVIVVSDSIELLESLELVPLNDEKEDQGFEFRVKNQNAELKGSLITDVYVSDKHALTDLICDSAEVVLDSAVLVLDDPEADIQLCARNCANLYMSSHQGLSLRSLSAVVHGTGRCQLVAPSINIQNVLGLIVWGPSIMLILCPAISASIVTCAVIKDGDVGVYTETLKANDMLSVVGLSGTIDFTGYGAVLRQTTGVGVNGEVNTGRIMSATATAYFGWSGRALVQAVHNLDAKSLFSGTVEYTNPKPAAITESSWLWWRENKTPSEIVKPATNLATKSYEVRNPPPRQLMPVHYFVNKGKFYMDKGKTPALIRAEEYSWTSRYSTELGVAAAVGAVAFESPLQKLELNVLDVVFVDVDPVQSGLDEPPSPTLCTTGGEHKTPAPVLKGKAVAEIVVTSDSSDLLKNLELIPLTNDNQDQSCFIFRVKNHDAELRGSILAQVLLSEKNALREFQGHTAAFVLGDAVLVQNNPDADVKVEARNSTSLYHSPSQGFALRSLDLSAAGAGTFQFTPPKINVRDDLLLVVYGSCAMAIATDTISATKVASQAVKENNVVCTSNLKASQLSSIIGLSGTITVAGGGGVAKQTAMIASSGEISTGGIAAKITGAVFGWSGHALVQATEELDVSSVFFGMVKYADTEPEVITEASGLWWRANKAPSRIVKPVVVPAKLLTKPCEFRDPPLRQPMAVHYMKKDSEPELESFVVIEKQAKVE